MDTYIYTARRSSKVNHSNIVTIVLISRARGREYKSRMAWFEQSGKSLKPVNASIVSSRLTFNSDILFPVDKRDPIVERHSGRVARNQPRISNEKRLLRAFSTFGDHPPPSPPLQPSPPVPLSSQSPKPREALRSIKRVAFHTASSKPASRIRRILFASLFAVGISPVGILTCLRSRKLKK